MVVHAEALDGSDEDLAEEEHLLAPVEENASGGTNASVYDGGLDAVEEGTLCSELHELFPLAWQTVLATVLQSMTQQVTVLFVGHIGVTELGAAALATMWVNITGLSIVYGGSTALDSLAAQAHGAKNFTLVGLWTMRFLCIVSLMCFPICGAWWYGCAPVLRAIGIDEQTAQLSQQFARVYTLWMWPTFANRAFQSFLRAQGQVIFVSVATVIGLVVHVPTTYALVQWLGFSGAPLALALNAWFVFVMLLAYVKVNRKAQRCWPSLGADSGNEWSELLRGWGLLLRMGAAGAAAMMGVWWSWELLSGMAGIMGEVSLAAHVAMQQFGMFFFPFFLGGAMAATSRVGNLLGAGDPHRARVCAKAALLGTTSVMGTILTSVIVLRHKFAYVYTSDERVVSLAADVAWFFVFNQFITCQSVVLQGILTGCGRQAINAKVALFASYCVGIPCSLLFGFFFEFGVIGLWGGLGVGQCVRAGTLHTLVWRRSDWTALAKEARERAHAAPRLSPKESAKP